MLQINNNLIIIQHSPGGSELSALTLCRKAVKLSRAIVNDYDRVAMFHDIDNLTASDDGYIRTIGICISSAINRHVEHVVFASQSKLSRLFKLISMLPFTDLKLFYHLTDAVEYLENAGFSMD